MAQSVCTPARQNRVGPPPFAARLPWLGGDLQTLRNYLVQPRVALGPWPGLGVAFDAADGSGDRLTGTAHMTPPDLGRPGVVIIHGLTGCEDGVHIRRSALIFLNAGYSVLRLNLRGAGASRLTCGGHYNAGASADLGAVLTQLEGVLPGFTANGVVALAYSLGANLMLKYLGETGGLSHLRAAVSVSAPIDLSATSAHMLRPRNWLYHRWLLKRLKTQTLEPGARVSAEGRRAVLAARTIWELDDQWLAPAFGFAGAQDYYARSSAAGFLAKIAKPTLLIHADNDPWVPVAQYRAYPWRDAPMLTYCETRGGGHVGFHGVGSALPWHDRAALAFFAATCPPSTYQP